MSVAEKRVDKPEKVDKGNNYKIADYCTGISIHSGSIISMSVVFRRVARIMTGHCQISVAAADAWDTPQTVDD